MLLAPLDQLPADIQGVIRSDTRIPVNGPVNVTAAGLTGWACVQETDESWLLTLELA
ncbi:hypothetical protein ACFSC4_28300 [Deinococcus malanensis]